MGKKKLNKGEKKEESDWGKITTKTRKIRERGRRGERRRKRKI